jgi:hypothetical protein
MLRVVQEVKNTSFSVFLEVKTCSKALLAPIAGYGESPCFSAMGFLLVGSPNWRHYISSNVDGADFLECAF